MISIIHPNWTEERIADLKEMWAQGKSGSQIGLVLGISRNAVIGKVHRMGLPQRNPTGPNGGRLPAKPRVRRHKLRRTPNPKHFIWEPGEPLTERVHEPLGPPVLFILRKPHQCCWPLDGDGVEMRCCGMQKLGTLSYCLTHARMAYRKAPNFSEMERAKRAITLRQKRKAYDVRRAA